MSSPTEGEIWLVAFDPTVGPEIRKTRPAVVISDPALDGLPLRVVVPLTGWQDRFTGQITKMRVEATPVTGLAKDSAADLFQVKSVSTRRFVRKLGFLSERELDEVRAGVATVINCGD